MNENKIDNNKSMFINEQETVILKRSDTLYESIKGALRELSKTILSSEWVEKIPTFEQMMEEEDIDTEEKQTFVLRKEQKRVLRIFNDDISRSIAHQDNNSKEIISYLTLRELVIKYFTNDIKREDATVQSLRKIPLEGIIELIKIARLRQRKTKIQYSKSMSVCTFILKEMVSSERTLYDEAALKCKVSAIEKTNHFDEFIELVKHQILSTSEFRKRTNLDASQEDSITEAVQTNTSKLSDRVLVIHFAVTNIIRLLPFGTFDNLTFDEINQEHNAEVDEEQEDISASKITVGKQAIENDCQESNLFE